MLPRFCYPAIEKRDVELTANSFNLPKIFDMKAQVVQALPHFKGIDLIEAEFDTHIAQNHDSCAWPAGR